VVAPVPFTGNVRDMCNENGFQWEFACDRCGNGFQSPFEQNVSARGKGVLRMAGEWFGGAVEKFSSGVEDFNRYGWMGGEGSATKDRHFTKAVEAVTPNFRQCRGCGSWMCAQFCWNNDVGQCMQCSPLASEEIAKAQSYAQRQQFYDAASQQNWTSGHNMGEVQKLRCDQCGASTSGGKFCGQCGASLIKAVHCTHCGTQASPGAMFCAGCGHQL
jgi:hypothetical protein